MSLYLPCACLLLLVVLAKALEANEPQRLFTSSNYGAIVLIQMPVGVIAPENLQLYALHVDCASPRAKVYPRHVHGRHLRYTAVFKVAEYL